jgi:hypothetical protein
MKPPFPLTRKPKKCVHTALESFGDNFYRCMNKNCGKFIKKQQVKTPSKKEPHGRHRVYGGSLNSEKTDQDES